MRSRRNQLNAWNIPTVIVLLATDGVAFKQPQMPPQFFIRISETKIDLSPAGSTGTDCIAIQANGRFYLERRLQPLPGAEAKLSAFESRLTKARMEQLRALVDEPRIADLPKFVLPDPLIGVTQFSTFIVELNWQSAGRRLGYFAWKGTAKSGVSPDSAPDQVKRNWQESQEALRSLETWFHEVEGQKMRPANARSTECGSQNDAENNKQESP
jgi:hypothetical protein